MERLRLEVRDFAGPLRWRWLLMWDETGSVIDDHQVDISRAQDREEAAAFADLHGFLLWHAVPDRQEASEAEIIARVGAWAGREVLGRIGAAIARLAPVTVRVVVPAVAGFLASWPLELAHANGSPLAARGDVAFAYDLASGEDWLEATRPARDGRKPEMALRMLAVFSQPSATEVLALRRERYELTALIRQIVARQQRQVELAVMQYGATRQRLADVVQAGDGWDVLHLSGHGGRGQFLLEAEGGLTDSVSTDELVALLRPLRRRVRVAVVSSCESAAATIAETLRWVGLDEQAERFEQPASQEVPPGEQGIAPLARALNAELRCPVVAMRYPVADEFAIAFAGDLYGRLLGTRDPRPGGRAEPLDKALARAAAAAAGQASSAFRPALSVVTPVLLGGDNTGLVLDAPRVRPDRDNPDGPDLNPSQVRMHKFPDEPERFVGRTAAMAAAGVALAPGSGQPGVVLHGMAGAGKTACAIELAYRHQGSFTAAAFWQAPADFRGALWSLALELETQLEEFRFTMRDKITSAESVAAFASRLRRLLADNGVLLVLDNMETLLREDGRWRDPHWEPLMAAMTAAGGQSRLILTSRVLPAGLGSAMLSMPVHALSLAESAVHARELPGLRKLLHGDEGPVHEAVTVAEDRDLFRRVLLVVQGHPKLMELADAAAADHSVLAARVEAAERASDRRTLDAFFRDGTSSLDGAQFLDNLSRWTEAATTTLPEPARMMARFLACLEDPDRETAVIEANWPNLWRRLDGPGDPPSPGPLLTALTRAALVEPGPAGLRSAGEDVAANHANLARWSMHPGVAQAIRDFADTSVQAAVDAELSAFWERITITAYIRPGGEDGQMIGRAGLSAAPYFFRRQEWDKAITCLAHVLTRDKSSVVRQAALTILRDIVSTTGEERHALILASVLKEDDTVSEDDPVSREGLLHEAVHRAVAEKDYMRAFAFAGDLLELLVSSTRLAEALELADQQTKYARLAGAGPWTQLSGRVSRLHILAKRGEHDQVLDEIAELLPQMDRLPSVVSPGDSILPWTVRESILQAGHVSAATLEHCQQALDFTTAIVASQKARGAHPLDLARMQFNDYGVLITLDRLAEARKVLEHCQQVYENYGETAELAAVMGARGELEDSLGNLAEAVRFAQAAIRYAYIRADPESASIGHHNLAMALDKTGTDTAAQRAHLLSAALICLLAGMRYEFGRTRHFLARELRADADTTGLPTTLDEVISAAEQTDGVHLRQLLDSISPDREAVAAALGNILRSTAPTGSDLPRGIRTRHVRGRLNASLRLIDTAVAAGFGNPNAAARFRSMLDEMAENRDQANLGAVLRSIVDGQYTTSLQDGLDPVATAIAADVLRQLTVMPPDPS